MNLHGIVAGYIDAVNPRVLLSVQLSTGNTVGSSFKQVPQYAPAIQILGQIQSLTYRDLQQTEGLNLQGTRRAIYFYGDVEAIVRSKGFGGSLVTTPAGDIYKVAQVLETWGMDGSADAPGWCKVIATLQNNA